MPLSIKTLIFCLSALNLSSFTLFSEMSAAASTSFALPDSVAKVVAWVPKLSFPAFAAKPKRESIFSLFTFKLTLYADFYFFRNIFAEGSEKRLFLNGEIKAV